MNNSRTLISWSQLTSGILAALLSTIAILTFDHQWVWILFASLSASSAVAFIIRSGWLIPCTVLGVIVGGLADPPIKGGPLDAQMEETARYVFGGAIAGLVVGLFVDGVGNVGDSRSKENP